MSVLYRWVRDRLHWLSHNAWALGFLVAGRIKQPRPRIDDPGSERILVIATHPDDELAGCGGTLVRHLSRGAHVTVVIVTDGRRSAAFGLAPEDMARERRKEAARAAAILGVSKVRMLGFNEGSWVPEDLRQSLHSCIRSVEPDLIYTPSCLDFHPEHRHVAQQLALVLPTNALVRIYQSQVPITSQLTNLLVDVTRQRNVIMAAADAYRTQLGSLQGIFRMRRYAANFYGVGRLAEEFWELSGTNYARIHRDLPLATDFRGLRPQAFSDPLAYWTGRRIRNCAKDCTRE